MFLGIWGIGVATQKVNLNQIPLGRDVHSLVMRNDGALYHNNEEKNRLPANSLPQEGDVVVSFLMVFHCKRLNSNCFWYTQFCLGVCSLNSKAWGLDLMRSYIFQREHLVQVLPAYLPPRAAAGTDVTVSPCFQSKEVMMGWLLISMSCFSHIREILAHKF